MVEAILFEKGMEDGVHFKNDLPDGVNVKGFEVGDPHDTTIYPYINTLEGRHYINPGDYIITGVKGERYPCKPDIFEATYDPVDNAHAFSKHTETITLDGEEIPVEDVRKR